MQDRKTTALTTVFSDVVADLAVDVHRLMEGGAA